MTTVFWKRAGVILLLVSLTCAVFWPVGTYPYCGFDDWNFLAGKSRVSEGLSLSGLRWAFTTIHAEFWHPVVWLSYMLDVELFGMDPGMMHLMNLFLHLLSTILLFVTLEALTGSRGRSAFVAAMFGIHPLHVESVVWISERKDVLSGLFWMLSLAAYLRYLRLRRLGRYLAVLAVFALGLMAKPMLVTLPLVLLLLDYWPLGRFAGAAGGVPGSATIRSARLVVEKIPLFVIAAGFAAVAVFAEGRGGTLAPLDVLPLWARLANAVNTYGWYVGRTLWPTSLAVHYPHPGTHVNWWQLSAAAVFLAVVTVALLRSARRRPALVVAWLWYLGTLVPVIGLVQIGDFARADHFTYLPLIGLFVLAAWGARDRAPRLGGNLPLVLAGSAVVLCAAAGRVQVGYWRDDVTLFSHALAVTQGNYNLENNLGVSLMDQGQYAEAIPHFREALRLVPSFNFARLNLGRALSRLGRDEEAEFQFREAIRREPRDPRGPFSLGRHLEERGRLEEALACFEKARRLDPGYPQIDDYQARVLQRLRQGTR